MKKVFLFLIAVSVFILGSCTKEITEIQKLRDELNKKDTEDSAEKEKLQKEIEELKKVIEELSSTEINTSLISVQEISNILSETDSSQNIYLKLDNSVEEKDLSLIAETLKENSQKQIILDLSKSKQLNTITSEAFKDCTTITSVIFPETITTVQKNAFSGCTNLATVCIPQNAEVIEVSAFKDCTNLKEIIVKDSETYIHQLAFQGCTDIVNVEGNSALINSVDSIINHKFDAVLIKGENSIQARYFSDLKNLDNLTVNFGPKIIEEACFENSSISQISIPLSVEKIFDFAFKNTNLTSIYIPESVTHIGVGIVSYCKELAAISVSESNPVYNSGDNCNAIFPNYEKKYDRPYSDLICGCKNTIIPDYTLRIGKSAFEGLKLDSIILPDSVEFIEDNAFAGCIVLNSIKLSSNLLTIGDGALHSLGSIPITIPSSIFKIGVYGLYGNRNVFFEDISIAWYDDPNKKGSPVLMFSEDPEVNFELLSRYGYIPLYTGW